MVDMKTNEGTLDRGLRAALAVVVALVAAFAVKGAFSIVLWVVAAVLAVTAVAGFCPLYRVFGVNTCKVKN